MARVVTEAQAQSQAGMAIAGPAVLDGWRMILEMLEGMVAMAQQFGYPEQLAREMVARQFIGNLAAAQAQQG